MSIHSLAEIGEEEVHESRHFTRDRFGKRHALASEDGTPRIGSIKKVVALFFLFGGLTCPLLADSGESLKRPNTNVQITSDDLEPFSLDDKLNRMRLTKEDKPVLYKEGDSMIGFNENGEPALITNF